MINQHILIGIAGHKGSGKSTVARQLIKYLYRDKDYECSVLHFAQPIKQLVCEQFDIDTEQLERVKNNPIVRQCLQNVGSQGRQQDPAHWINQLEKFYNNLKSSVPAVVIDDVRFQNEAFWIRRNAGILLHVHRKSVDSAADYHESEANIRYLGGDFNINNDGTVEELEAQVKEFIRKFKL